MLSGTEKGSFLKSRGVRDLIVLPLSDEVVVQGLLNEDFKRQLQLLDAGTYSTRLP